MDKRIFQAELATLLAKRAEMPVADAEKFVALFFSIISRGLAREKLVKVRGLGTFKVIDVSQRSSINVNTGERFEIASHAKVSFTPEASLRDIINRPFDSFETVVLNEGTDLTRMEAGTTDEAELTEQIETPELAETSEPEATTEPSDIKVSDATEETVDTIEPVVTGDLVKTDEKNIDNEPIDDETLPSAYTKDDENAGRQAETSGAAESTPLHSVGKKKGCSGVHILWCCVAACVLFATGYVIGYYRPVSLTAIGGDTASKDTAAIAVNASDSITRASNAHTVEEQTAEVIEADEAVTPEAMSYPQMEDGEYLIIGVRDSVIVKPGMTLINMSIKYYKNENLYIYILKMNGIDKPNQIQPNQLLLIPELYKKEQQEQEQN